MSMTPQGYEAVIHVSLTDDPPLAQAFVVIEARPVAEPGPMRTGPRCGECLHRIDRALDLFPLSRNQRSDSICHSQR